MKDLNLYKNKRVLVTGHTGFKGSWLVTWLKKLGAEVVGYSLPAQTEPSHYNLLHLDMVSLEGDIRDLEKLKETFSKYQPEIVFHLAAQSLVRESYHDPIETYDVNVMGTLKVFEAARSTSSVKSFVNVTSDKCYENKEWPWGYRENDPMGGFDPYSSSKGCSELLTASYRNSYFSESNEVLLASARAGNVIGGGDWANNRLLPDAMRAFAVGEILKIRSPHAIRPWQHVLEPLRGYLMLGAALMQKNQEAASGWNFGPNEQNCITVEELLKTMSQYWDGVRFEVEENPFHEAGFLKLDSSKARQYLAFQPLLSLEQTLEITCQWYKEYYQSGQLLTHQQIDWYSDLFTQS